MAKTMDDSKKTAKTGGLFHRLRAKIALLVLAALVVFCVVVMIANYRFPQFFEPEYMAEKPGSAYIDTLVVMGEKMTEHWLPNDLIWPTVFLDNPQNFQLGQLELMRYSVRVLRDNLSRLRTTDDINVDANAAFQLFSNDPEKWIWPSAESKYREAVKKLKSYQTALLSDQASFYPRADNLTQLLEQYISLLGGVNTRLSNAPRRKGRVLSEETAGDQYSEGEKMVAVRVPWTKIDDNFYYAQGVAYGLRQNMVAVKYDFKHILETKRATELVDRIINVLDESQFEPLMVMNGKRGSIWANHSLQLQSLLEDARQKMSSLAEMISK